MNVSTTPHQLSPGAVSSGTVPVKYYRVSPARLAVIPVFLLLLEIALLAGSCLVGTPRERFALLATAGTTFCIIFPFVFLVRYTRLSLSPGGLEVRQLGYRLKTTWDNIQEIRLDRGCEGLVLREPMKGGGVLALKTGFLLPVWYRSWQVDLVSRGVWIPLEPFSWHFRHGDLLEEIRRYAPGLVLK
jgi:hypothetical protein